MEHLLDVVCGGPLLPLGPHMRKLESYGFLEPFSRVEKPPVSSLRRRRPEFVTREGSQQLGRENT
nr:hypothetical protein Iba_scaffold44236CG0010 [Ipomoea batatas]